LKGSDLGLIEVVFRKLHGGSEKIEEKLDRIFDVPIGTL
jgi:hypothetical protein